MEEKELRYYKAYYKTRGVEINILNREGTYYKDRPHGVWIYYKRNSDIEFKGMYDMWKMVGHWLIDTNKLVYYL